MLEIEHSSKPVVVAGEESGGFTIRGHIPEKDGFVAVSTILDLVASEGKPVGEILKEVKEKAGIQNQKTVSLGVAFEKTREGYEKQSKTAKGFEKYLNGTEDKLQGFDIDKERTMEYDKHIKDYKGDGDGSKIFLKDGSSALIRKSGTEPKVRIYVDTRNPEVYDKLTKNLPDEAKSYANS
jgi:phosphomannomutase